MLIKCIEEPKSFKPPPSNYRYLLYLQFIYLIIKKFTQFKKKNLWNTHENIEPDIQKHLLYKNVPMWYICS